MGRKNNDKVIALILFSHLKVRNNVGNKKGGAHRTLVEPPLPPPHPQIHPCNAMLNSVFVCEFDAFY